MKVFRYGEQKIERCGDSSLTIGSFDGVHRGHRKLLAAICEGQCPTVVTFDPHPQTVLRMPGDRVSILTPLAEKLRKLENAGVERAVVIPFNREMAARTADDFMQNILVEEVGLKKLIVGYNHSFGRGREGDIEFMRRNQERYGYELQVIDAHDVDGETVSSTKVRNALKEAALETANRFLGSPYRMAAQVVGGDGRGAKLGYPTANLEPLEANQLIPAEGVYAMRLIVGDRVYDGVGSIGRKETFGKHLPIAVEIHLFDVELDIYGQRVDAQFLGYLRGQRAFASVEALTEQMEQDCTRAREALTQS